MKTILTDYRSDADHRANRGIKRSSFLTIMGAGSLVTAVLSGCDDNDNKNSRDVDVDLGSGDTGILNFAFALEQLESSFYEQVTAHSAFTTIFSATERAVLTEIRDNEVVHREFYKTVLGAGAIRDLETDFSAIDFSSRDKVLTTARTFEDTGIAAYNGAARFLVDDTILAVAGKIVSVEGRHSAILRNLLAPKTAAFAGDDVINAMGLDQAIMPAQILEMVQPYLKDKLNGNNLPRV